MTEDPEEQPEPDASPHDAAVPSTSDAGTSHASEVRASDGHACGAEGADDTAGRADDDVHNAALDAMTELLREQARRWARQVRVMLQLDVLTERGAAGRGQFAQLEMAGSWNVSQLTATRWREEARRFDEALPRTLAMLETGALLVHQSSVLLHRTRHCTVQVARAVEEQVLPAGAGLCPADLSRRVVRTVLRVEAELDAAATEQRHADAAAQRRTFHRPEQDGMGLAGAVLTAEQLVAWQAALDALERRERAADRAAGVVRTVEQRKADLFAALPAMVLAGTAQDRAALADLARAGLPVPGMTAPFTTAPSSTGPSSTAPSSTAPSSPGPSSTAPCGPAPSGAGVGGSSFGSGAGASAPTGGSLVPVGAGVAASGLSATPVPSADVIAAAAAVVAQGRAADGTPVDSGTAATPASPAGCPRLAPWTLGLEQLAAHVVLNVLVPVSTVLGLSREPGTLSGYGPVSAEHIQLLRPRSWRRVMVDSRSGRPVALDDRLTPADPDPEKAHEQVQAMLRPEVVVDADEPQHDPSARLARLVDLRDVHCCGPGCSSSRTDRDHLDPWPHGPTSARNLARLSRRCHRAKHSGWHLQRHDDGSVTWTSPLGRTYSRPSPHDPPPHVDLHTDLPPLRPRPDRAAARPDDAPRWLALDDLTTSRGAHDDAAGPVRGGSGAEPLAGEDQADLDDEPPPF